MKEDSKLSDSELKLFTFLKQINFFKHIIDSNSKEMACNSKKEPDHFFDSCG